MTPPPINIIIVSSTNAKRTHTVCRRNPNKRGAAKWEPMFGVSAPPEASVDDVGVELVKRQRLKAVDLLRSRVCVIAKQ